MASKIRLTPAERDIDRAVARITGDPNRTYTFATVLSSSYAIGLKARRFSLLIHVTKEENEVCRLPNLCITFADDSVGDLIHKAEVYFNQITDYMKNREIY